MMQNSLKVVIAGGTGFIGHALVREFAGHGYQVTVLSRSAKPVPNAAVEQWDGKTVGNWASSLEGCDAVINVVGESVFSHWTEQKKREIMTSRVDPTRAIGKAVAACKQPPRIWVNASAVGYYGSVFEPTDEGGPPGSDYLAEVCKEWEKAQLEFNTPQTKTTQARIGFVLGKDGGALPMLQKLTKSFLGSAQGSGKQFMAWVHIDDVAAAFRFCVEKTLEGPVNIVGPSPITNNDLMSKLRKDLHKPWAPNVPKFALKIGSAFSLPPTDVTLSSQNVVPKRLLDAQYPFRFPTLDAALDDLLK